MIFELTLVRTKVLKNENEKSQLKLKQYHQLSIEVLRFYNFLFYVRLIKMVFLVGSANYSIFRANSRICQV